MEKQVLIVDHDVVMRCAVSCILREAGYETCQAHDGQQALELILEREKQGDPFDLVLTDHKVRGASGMKLMHELAQQQVALPVIVFIAKQENELTGGLWKLGCSHVLETPFEVRHLLQKVSSALESPVKEAPQAEEASRGRVA